MYFFHLHSRISRRIPLYTDRSYVNGLESFNRFSKFEAVRNSVNILRPFVLRRSRNVRPTDKQTS